MTGLILSGIAAILLIMVGAHALIKQRNTPSILLFAAALLLALMEIGDQLSMRSQNGLETFSQVSHYLELLLSGTFLLVGITYGRSRPFDAFPKVQLGFIALLAFFPAVVFYHAGPDLYYSPDFQNERTLFLADEGYWYYLGIMASFIVSLVNVETTLAATHGMARNRTKFEAIGLMCMLAVLIFYYSQGLLYRTINMDLVPVRSGVLILAALLIGYSRIYRGSSTPVVISRHVLYRSITLLVIGIYLMILGLLGEGMRYFGVTFGRELTIILAFAGGALLLAVLFSENMRRRVKVYINKHFYANNKHDYRAEWIKFTNKLSSCVTLHDVQESVLDVYRETFGLAGASMYLVSRDESRYIRTIEQFMPESPKELRLSEELHAYFLKRERVLDLKNRENQLNDTELTLFKQGGTWLIVPLISRGKVEGLAALREQIIPEKFTYDDYDLMKVLARQAAQAITNLRLAGEVIEMRAMAAVSRISTFVIHDLKNLTTGLSLVVDNAAEHMGNPDFQHDAIKTVKNTLLKMKALMQRLKSIPERVTIKTVVEDIDRLCQDVVSNFVKTGQDDTRIVYKGSPVLSGVDSEEIKMVLINLIHNALEASAERQVVEVKVFQDESNACIRVSDTGCGMTEHYLKYQLFKPFSTTKEKGLGIGLYQCKLIVEAHDGRIAVESGVNKGTVFTIYLPIHKKAEEIPSGSSQ